jgi:hypothetical protein
VRLKKKEITAEEFLAPGVFFSGLAVNLKGLFYSQITRFFPFKDACTI